MISYPKKLMGETVGANSNLIVLTPAGIDVTKVFGTTELEAIFKNDNLRHSTHTKRTITSHL